MLGRKEDKLGEGAFDLSAKFRMSTRCWKAKAGVRSAGPQQGCPLSYTGSLARGYCDVFNELQSPGQPSPLSALGPQCHEVWGSPRGPLSAQLCFALGDQTLLAL